MSDASVRGIVHYIEETKTYGQKGFRKRQVVLEQDGERFTNYVPVDFIQDGCDSVDELKTGDDVEITYRLSGRKWQKDPQSDVKYFLNAEATGFKVVSSGGAAGSGNVADANVADANVADANQAMSEASYDEEDIPF